MPNVLEEDTCEVLRQKVAALSHDVTLIYVPKSGQQEDEVGALLSELAGLSGRIKILRHGPGSAEAQGLGITEGPVIIFRGELVKGDARYYGTPEGYEFEMFVECILMAGGAVRIGGPAEQLARSLSSPLKLEVFVTTACPYCPTSAYIALKLAMLSPLVKSHVYNAPEFPEVSRKYGVSGVPKTVINDGAAEYMGGHAEDVAVLNIRKALHHK